MCAMQKDSRGISSVSNDFSFFSCNGPSSVFSEQIKSKMEIQRMKKILGLGLALSFAAAIACSGGGYAAPSGSIMQNTTLNHEVPAPSGVGGKSGEACVVGYLGIISSGDASIKAAAAAGGISTVK